MFRTDDFEPCRLNRERRAWVLGAMLVVGVTLRLAIAWGFYGTNDVDIHLHNADVYLRGLNIYEYGVSPSPALEYLLAAGVRKANLVIGLPFSFMIKAPAMLADALIAVLLYLIGGSTGAWWRRGLTLAGLYVWSPVAILISGYHGTPHPVIVLATVLSVYLLSVRRSPALSGLTLGLGASIKPFPVILLPLLIHHAEGWRERLRLAIGFFVPLGVFLLPYATQPGVGRVFGYSSYYGGWGFSLIFKHWAVFQDVVGLRLVGPGALGALNDFLTQHGRYLLVVAFAGVYGVLLTRVAGTSPESAGNRVFKPICLIYLTFYFWTLGFGVQHLGWILPFLIVFAPRVSAIYSVFAGAFLLLTYRQFWLAKAYYDSIAEHFNQLASGDLLVVAGAVGLGLILWAWFFTLWMKLMRGYFFPPFAQGGGAA